MEDSPKSPTFIKLDDQGRIDHDLPCASCDYNLRTISPDATCPECGQVVTASLDPTRLCFANRIWLRQITRGLTLTLLGLVFPVIALIISQTTSYPASRWAIVTCILTFIALLIVGYWFCSTPDPDMLATSRFNRTARRARMTVVLGVLVVAPIWLSGQYQWLDIRFILPFILLLPAAIAFSIYRHACQIADRLPATDLVKASRYIIWLYLIFVFTDIILMAIFLLPIYGGNTPQTAQERIITGLVGRYIETGMLIFAMAAGVFVVLYRRRVGKVLQQMGER